MNCLCSRLRQQLCRRRAIEEYRGRHFSNNTARDGASMEEEVERKFGYLLKFIFAGTASAVAYQFFPYMGETLLQQSVSLLHVKDPLFKRMGASRLTRFAIDDERRMKIVEIGGAHELLKMLEAAKDDKTRKMALKALVALAHSEEVAGILHGAGAVSIVSSTPNSKYYAEVESCKSSLLKRFQDLNLDVNRRINVQGQETPVVRSDNLYEVLNVVHWGLCSQMAFDSNLLSLLDVEWLGVLPSDLDAYYLPDRCLLPFDSSRFSHICFSLSQESFSINNFSFSAVKLSHELLADKLKAVAMLKRCYLYKEVPQWRSELELMLVKGAKLEIEALSVTSFSFLSETYLPAKIQGLRS